MAVGSDSLGDLHPVAGIRMSAVSAGIKKPGRLDVVLFEIAENAVVEGLYTQNAFCAAPVRVAKEHNASHACKYFLINTGNANAGTGEAGYQDALACCKYLADLAAVDVTSVLPFSTGVIGEKLPVNKITNVIPLALESLDQLAWEMAAVGIMTTDTRPKASSIQIDIAGEIITITGLAKGAGMLKPNMATMLGYVFTDLNIEQGDLRALLKQAADVSFNRITVDGDTSTNDCCMLVATGKSSAAYTSLTDSEKQNFIVALQHVFTELAKGLVRDAEGATKFVTIKVKEGSDRDESLSVAYAIAESPLVKTALFASDPNWGRILAVVGRSGLHDLDINKVKIGLNDLCIVKNGSVDPDYTEAAGQDVMNQEEIEITVHLGRGKSEEILWTSDLSHDYVRINAEYRT